MSASTHTYRRLFVAALFASALVVACAPSGHAEGGAAGQSEASPATQASNLVLRWTIIVSDRFEGSRAFKSDVTDGIIDQFLSGGAVRTVGDKATEAKLHEIDGIVDKFTATVITNGQRHDDGSREVTDASVLQAINSTCPVYPFC